MWHKQFCNRIQDSEFKSFEIFMIMAPVISCRRVTIADMYSLRFCDYSFRFGRTRAHYHIISSQIQTFKSIRPQKWNHLIDLSYEWDFLKERHINSSLIKNWISELFKNWREDISFRENSHNIRKHFFGSSKVFYPVCHNGDSFVFHDKFISSIFLILAIIIHLQNLHL